MDVDNNIAQLERIIGHSFNNKLLCAEALRMGPPTALLLVEGKVHSVKNNGRMETYGDRLLEQVLCELWYNSRYPSGKETTYSLKHQIPY
jgi:dsRNA-specific ribonuclease